jgi:hypothetical protein
MSKEDKLVDCFIRHFRNRAEDLEKYCGEYNFTTLPEASYNHYGERGYVDIFVELNFAEAGSVAYICEIKSESAVREATGANEIVRQFNKMRENFFRGSSHKPPDNFEFELCFTPTEYNIRHIYDNIEIYHSSCEQTLIDIGENKHHRVVSVRPLTTDNFFPIRFCDGEFCPAKDTNFSQFAEDRNEIVYSKHEEVFAEISGSNHLRK